MGSEIKLFFLFVQDVGVKLDENIMELSSYFIPIFQA